MSDKVIIVYFSGTGCTALAAKTLAYSFREKGTAARTEEIFRHRKPSPEPGETLVLMFPVYAGDAPEPVYEWIRSLEKSAGVNSSVISVSGGGSVSPNTACRAKAIKRLEKKGFAVISDYMLCMPANFITPTPDAIAHGLIRVLPQKCALIADEIKEGRRNRKKPFFIDRVIKPLFSMEKLGAKVYGRTLKAQDGCNGCGLCAEKCPRGNIVMDGEKPCFGWRCVICMRCVYACPKNAIRARFPVLKRMVIKDGFSLSKLQKTTHDAGDSEIFADGAGFLWKAVINYINDSGI